MAYTPTPGEARRLERAIELAKFTEAERVLWLSAFVMVVVVIVSVLAAKGPWPVAVGAFFGLFLLYWRLRGAYLAGRVRGDHGLFGVNLATREQRAFTALMLRQVLTGRNALATKPEHDPLARWRQQSGPREAAPEEE